MHDGLKLRQRRALGLRAAVWSVVGLGVTPAWAAVASGPHVVLDGTLGRSGPIQPLNGNHVIPADAGRTVGSNLFHSFGRLDLDKGEVATFTGPNSIHNVLARVTGGQASQIDGTIRCTIPDASFYLVNPAGVLFGPDAALDVKGSFAVTTADVIRLSDGGKFAASLAPADSVLTTAAPAAFGFLAAVPMPVGVVGSSAASPVLAVGPDKVLSIVSGPIVVAQAGLRSDTGRVNIVAVASPGDVTLDPADRASSVTLGAGQQGGTVALSQAQINRTLVLDHPVPGGGVVIRGGDLVLDQSKVYAQPASDLPAAAKDVDIGLTGTLTATASQVIGSTGDANPGANVVVRASAVVVAGTSTTTAGDAQIEAAAIGAGKGGDVTIDAGTVTVKSGGLIRALTGGGTGGAGSVRITADTVTVDGQGSGAGVTTGIASLSQAGFTGAGTGAGGDVRIDATHIVLDNGGIIATSTFGAAPGGNVQINTTTLDLNRGSDIQSITVGNAAPPLSNGRAGNIDVRAAGAVTISGGAQIIDSTVGPGDAGSIMVQATDLTLDRAGSASFTGIDAESGDTDPTVAGRTFGQGGDVTIQVNNLTALNGAQVFAPAFGAGVGGNITITASDTIQFTGQYAFADGSFANSGIVANSRGSGSTGHGGNIAVQAVHLRLTSGGQIQAATFGPADAGSVALNVSDMTVDGAGTSAGTGINARSGVLASFLDPAANFGRGGDVTINLGSLLLSNGGQITGEAFGSGDGGNIHITATEGVRLVGFNSANIATVPNSSIDANTFGRAGGRGGSITVESPRIELTGGGSIFDATLGTGDAGTITLLGADLTLDLARSGALTEINASSGVLAGGAINELPLGKGGEIHIDGKSVTVLGGARIASDTFGNGAGGDVDVRTTGDVVLTGLFGDDTGARQASLIGSNTFGAQSGLGGGVHVQARCVELTDGGAISASTVNAAAGGMVRIEASKSVTVRSGPAPTDLPPVPAGEDDTAKAIILAVSAGGSGQDGTPDIGGAKGGRAGSIEIQAPKVTVSDGGFISTTTEGTGDSGTVNVRTHHLLLSGRSLNGLDASGLSSETRSIVAGAGNAGSVTVRAGTLRIVRGAGISTASTSSGEGGQIDVKAGRLLIDPRGFMEDPNHPTFMFNTGIVARSQSPSGGKGGEIRIAAGLLTMNRNGEISASTVNVDQPGGGINVEAGDANLFHSTMTAQAAGQGGNININVDHQLYLRSSDITGQAGGNGGQVVIDPPAIVLDGGSVMNGLSGGRPVVVRIEGELIKSPESRILTNANLAFPQTDISGALAALLAAYPGAGAQLAPQCGLRLGGDVSSFLITGRGGTPPEPGGWQTGGWQAGDPIGLELQPQPIGDGLSAP